MTTREEAQRELLRRKARAELERRKSTQPTTASGLLQAAGTGLRNAGEGIIGLAGDAANLGGMAGEWLGGKLGGSPEAVEAARANRLKANFLPTSQSVHEATTPFLGESYEPQSTAEEYVKTGAEFLPGLIGGPGNLARKAITNVAAPAIGAETAGQLTDDNPIARLIGALIGSTNPRRLVTPFPNDPSRERMAQTLMDEGVDLSAGQRTGNRGLQLREEELGGGAAQDLMQRQGEQFTSAALQRAGIQAARATPEVMDQAFTRIGNEFDTLARQTSIPFDQRFQDDLLDAAGNYAEMTGPSARAPLIENIMNDAAALSRGGTLDGEAYARLRTRITDGIRKGDSNTRGALMDMREALDDAVERSLPPDVVERWGTARNQYRNMLVLEDAAARAGGDAAAGIISPQNLRNATVSKHGKRNYVRGEGDFADLARSGAGVMERLPNSGTSARTSARNMGVGMSSLIGALLGHGAAPGIGSAAGLAAGAMLPPLAGRVMLSGPGRAMLGNQLMPGGAGGGAQRALIAALLSQQRLPVPQ